MRPRNTTPCRPVIVKLTSAAGRVSIAKAILGAPTGYPTWLTRTSGAAWPGGTGVAGVAGGAGVAVGPAGGV